jgi:hypothetical protein
VKVTRSTRVSFKPFGKESASFLFFTSPFSLKWNSKQCARVHFDLVEAEGRLLQYAGTVSLLSMKTEKRNVPGPNSAHPSADTAVVGGGVRKFRFRFGQGLGLDHIHPVHTRNLVESG